MLSVFLEGFIEKQRMNSNKNLSMTLYPFHSDKQFHPMDDSSNWNK